MKQPKGWLKLILGIVLAIVTFFAQAFLLIVWTELTYYGTNSLPSLAFAELAGGVIALLFVIALGGKAYLGCSSKALSFAWRAARVFLIADVVIVLLSLTAQIYLGESQSLADGWVQNVLLVFFLCLGVGIFEEGICRGLILQGLLARMGTTKKGVVAALIISSLAFGVAHVIPTNPMDHDLYFWLQTGLKTLQTGLVGFVLGTIVVKTRSLWPAILVHALNDFILMVITIGFLGEEMSFEYVVSGDESSELITVYLLMCAIYVPSVLFCIDELKKMPGGCRGAFIKQAQAPQAAAELPLYVHDAYLQGGYPQRPQEFPQHYEQAPHLDAQPAQPRDGMPIPPSDYRP